MYITIPLCHPGSKVVFALAHGSRLQRCVPYVLLHHESARAEPKVMDIDVRNLALLVHTFSRRFELSFSVWSFLQLRLAVAAQLYLLVAAR